MIGKQECQHCKQMIAEHIFDMHEFQCQKNYINCSVCQLRIHIDEEETHMITHQTKKQTQEQVEEDVDWVICDFCNTQIWLVELEQHTSVCGSRTDVCSFCFKNVVMSKLREHELECFRKQNFPQLVEKEAKNKQQDQKQKNGQQPKQVEQQQISNIDPDDDFDYASYADYN
ncbi:factor 1 [Paramecium bursaria]